MNLSAKSSKHAAAASLERHPITCPAALPDAGYGGWACLRCGKLRCRPLASPRAGRARSGGWCEPVCFGLRDIRLKARVAAVDCVRVIVWSVSSPLKSAEQAPLIGGLLGWQPARPPESAALGIMQGEAFGHRASRS